MGSQGGDKLQAMTEAEDDEQRLIEANAKLVKDDDTEVVCHTHGVTKRWGDLSPIAQLAVLAGLDGTDRCLMEEECKTRRPASPSPTSPSMARL